MSDALGGAQLLQLRDKIVEAIGAAMPSVEVLGHLGRFSEEQLQQFMISAPGVRVAILGLTEFKPIADDSGGVDAVAQIGVYAVAKDGSQRLSRDQAALAMVEIIIGLADRNRWALGRFARAGAQVRGAQNLFSAATLKSGVALWAIDLRQPVRLLPAAPDPSGPIAVYVGVAPDIGPGHEADYLLLGELGHV